MTPWRDLKDAEKIERLGSAVAILAHRLRDYGNHEIPGYTKINIEPTMEGWDDWLPLYGGNLSKKE